MISPVNLLDRSFAPAMIDPTPIPNRSVSIFSSESGQAPANHDLLSHPPAWVWRMGALANHDFLSSTSVGLARPRHGRRGPARASSGEQHHGSSASSPSLFHDFLSLPPEIRLPNTTSGGKLKKPTKPSLKNPFLMPKIRF